MYFTITKQARTRPSFTKLPQAGALENDAISLSDVIYAQAASVI